MLGNLFGRRRDSREIGDMWHRWILSKARDPAPFKAGWVDDTLEGRFQMVALVSTVVLRTLREHGDKGRASADAVYRAVFSGFDHALREEGVGDASIARRVRKMGEEFFGLARRLDTAFEAESPQQELAAAMFQNGVAKKAFAPQLADWLINTQKQVEQSLQTDTLRPG